MIYYRGVSLFVSLMEEDSRLRDMSLLLDPLFERCLVHCLGDVEVSSFERSLQRNSHHSDYREASCPLLGPC